jgi:hypothetical protein
MAKLLCVLYDDPVNGYPTSYARDDIPKMARYEDGQSAPSPEAIDFIDAVRGDEPHMSGTSLSEQVRYAAGTREILECWFEGRAMREEYVIVDGGKLTGTGAKAYLSSLGGVLQR